MSGATDVFWSVNSCLNTDGFFLLLCEFNCPQTAHLEEHVKQTFVVTKTNTFIEQTHLFVVHAGEVHTIHLHNLVTHLQVRIRHRSGSGFSCGSKLAFFCFFKRHLESNFCRQGAWLDVADVDPRFLGGTTGDADAHSPGAHEAEENLLLLDLFASDGRQACNAALFVL